MKLTDIMSRNVEVVRPAASIFEAAEKMRSLDVGVLPVTEGELLLGIITDRDITVRAVAQGRDPKSTRVQDCMTSGPVSCFEDPDSEAAVRLMEEKQIRRLPVLSRDNRLVGVVSLGDIATKLGKEQAGRATAAISSAGAGTTQKTRGGQTTTTSTPSSDAGMPKREAPIARNANPAGVSTARQVPDIPTKAQEESGVEATTASNRSSGAKTSKGEIPIARNANPKGVD
jgi:CBS domain-containing protein